VEPVLPLSLLFALSPALVAILLALTTRRVLPSLTAGVAMGALVAHGDSVLQGQILDALTAMVGFLLDAVVPGLSAFQITPDGSGNLLYGQLKGDLSTLDPSHLIITAFSLAVAGMVGVLSRSGGTRALVRLLEGLSRGPRGAQVAAWLSGMLIFFDDYANCLVVGSAMGPLFDRFRVSRAKLAYIVDSTAAPIASLAVVSTWVGYEVGLIASELRAAGSEAPAFSVFLAALPYRFYGFITLAMVGAVALSGRDFGPMLRAEALARRRRPPAPDTAGGRTGKAWAALVPVGLLIGITFAFLVGDGIRATWLQAREAAVSAGVADPGARAWAVTGETPWFDLLGAADPFLALLWGSLSALAVAIVLAKAAGTLSLREAPAAVKAGISPVIDALVVLFLAWALGNAMGATGAARELTDLVAPPDTVSWADDPVEVSWHTSEPGTGARLRILDAEGLVVHQELLGRLPEGPGRITWDGADPNGVTTEAGTFRVVITATGADGEPLDVMIRGEPRFPPWLLPAVVFLTAAFTAFATGTSFGTMGILIPLVVPLAVGLEPGPPGPLLLGGTAAVLAGAILGDHASPISDTTVLSALGAGVDLVTHVRTQLPYALTAGALSLVVGYVPAGLGVSPWILIPAGSALAVLVVLLVGRRSTPPPPELPESAADAPRESPYVRYEG
jgi:Na+/H+ antiporter NhaC